jgi:hypothetical protein
MSDEDMAKFEKKKRGRDHSLARGNSTPHIKIPFCHKGFFWYYLGRRRRRKRGFSHYRKRIYYARVFRGEGSTYTNWQQFGANKRDASSECPNIRSQYVWQPNRVLSVPQIDLSAREKWSICVFVCVIFF